jgi:IclR family transcriptional regulator, pca regulon regulatory protein
VGEPGTDRAEGLQSLTRGLMVIRSFDAAHPQLTLSDVARRTDLTRATVRRILLTLEGLGYVRLRDARFSLTPRVLELGGSYLASSSMAQVAQPHLEDLTEAVDESSSVSELDGDDIVYIARVSRRRIMAVTIGIGTRFPAYATSMGRVLLAGRDDDWLDVYLRRARLEQFTQRTVTDPERLRAELARVRQQGWCLIDEELEPGLRSVAVPVRGPGGEVVAAINVSATTRRSTAQIRTQILPALQRAAAEVSADLAAVRTR